MKISVGSGNAIEFEFSFSILCVVKAHNDHETTGRATTTYDDEDDDDCVTRPRGDEREVISIHSLPTHTATAGQA